MPGSILLGILVIVTSFFLSAFISFKLKRVGRFAAAFEADSNKVIKRRLMQIKSLFFLNIISFLVLGCSSLGHNRDACRLAREAPYGALLYPNGLIFIGDCSIVHKWRLETGNLLHSNSRELRKRSIKPVVQVVV